jgi:hypothetical protein
MGLMTRSKEVEIEELAFSEFSKLVRKKTNRDLGDVTFLPFDP